MNKIWTLFDRKDVDGHAFISDLPIKATPIGTFETELEVTVYNHVEMDGKTYAICMVSSHRNLCVGKVIEDFNGDTKYMSEMICPYCGHEMGDAWELSGDDGEEQETECGTCGREFNYQRNIEVTYSTSRK